MGDEEVAAAQERVGALGVHEHAAVARGVAGPAGADLVDEVAAADEPLRRRLHLLAADRSHVLAAAGRGERREAEDGHHSSEWSLHGARE